MPTHFPRSYFDESSKFDYFSKRYEPMAKMGEVDVNANIWRKMVRTFNFMWVRNVPSPSVAGILCIKMAKKMTIPSCDYSEDAALPPVCVAWVASELTKWEIII